MNMVSSQSSDKTSSVAITPRVVGDPRFARQIADILKTVAHPVRLQIVALLCRGPLHVNAIAEAIGVKQATVSQQLRLLRMHQLVSVQREGGFAHYSLAEPNLVNLIQCMEGCSVH